MDCGHNPSLSDLTAVGLLRQHLFDNTSSGIQSELRDLDAELDSPSKDALELATEELRSNQQVAMSAVTMHGNSLEHVAPALQADRDEKIVPSPAAQAHGHRQELPLTQRTEGKGKGKDKGKGWPCFQRIEVGIEDDADFRVVQRLIGPRGKFMKDIVKESKGAKVWVIGRGSSSWEDNVGPLQICVGAVSSAIFDSAVSLVQDLLWRVREEHRKPRQ